MKRWEEELSEGLTLDCLAEREGVERERVERLMGLLNLPEERQELILNNEPSIREVSIRDALKEAHAYQSWLGVREFVKSREGSKNSQRPYKKQIHIIYISSYWPLCLALSSAVRS